MENKELNLIYGLNGLMELLHVSKSTAYRIKSTGILDKCCYQFGRTIIFDRDKVLDTLRLSNQLPWMKQD